MKKTTELKVRIGIAWAISMIAYFIGCAIWMLIAINLDLGLGVMFVFAPFAGFFIPLPILLRQDSFIQHYTKVLNKKRGR